MIRTMKVGETDYIEFEVQSSNEYDTVVITNANCEIFKTSNGDSNGITLKDITITNNIISLLVSASSIGHYTGQIELFISPCELIEEFTIEVVK